MRFIKRSKTKTLSRKQLVRLLHFFLPLAFSRFAREKLEMRLITHNMLSCNIKGVTNGFPLRIEAENVIEKEVDFNPDFLRHMFAKIEWKALVEGARSMGYTELPEDSPDATVLNSDDESFLKKLHHALLELHLEEGALVCPETGRKFPVNKGIPNMLLHEDEV